jgi:PST family polysaccharide transporter
MPTPQRHLSVLGRLRSGLAGHDSLIRIAENSAWLVLDKGLRLLFGLVVGAWVARYLGPSLYGQLAYVLALVALFQAVAILGLDGIVVREIARDPSVAGAILGTAFILRLSAGVAGWLGSIACMAMINGPGDRSVGLTALAGAVLVFQAADTVDLWFQSQSQSRRTVFAKLTALLLSNGVKIWLILAGAPLQAFAAVMVVDAIAAALGLVFAYRRFPCAQRWTRVRGMSTMLLGEGWPFMLSGVAIMVYMRIDQIMIRELLSEHELGLYAAVVPLATVWQFIPMTLSVSLAPFVARKKAESEAAYWLALGRIFRAFSLFGWLACIVTLLLAGFIVSMLLGPEFSDGSAVLAIYVFTNLFIGLGVAQGLWLVNERLPILSLYKALIGAVVCVLGNFVLLPIMGIAGAAITAVLAQFTAAVLSNVVFSRRILVLQFRSLFLLRPKP